MLNRGKGSFATIKYVVADVLLTSFSITPTLPVEYDLKIKPILIIGDTHAPTMLHEYPEFLQSVCDKYKCKSVIHIGDLVDLHCLSYHERNPDLPSVPEEIENAIQQIGELTKRFRHVDLLIGNHDDLISRKAVTAGISTSLLKNFEQAFDLPRSWKVHPRYTKLHRNGVIYLHGDQGKGGQQAALKNAQAEFCSVVQGHYHAQAGVWYHSNESKLIFGMQVGCGIDRTSLQMQYGVKFSAKPIISCGVVIDSRTAFVETMNLGEDP